jgi:hypothetical protein
LEGLRQVARHCTWSPGDFNHDGFPDLAKTDFSANKVADRALARPWASI